MEEFRVALDFRQEFGIGEAEIFDGRIVAVDQGAESEAIDEAFYFAGGHGFFLEVDELDGRSAFFEESFRGARGLRIVYSEDLDGHSWEHNAVPLACQGEERPILLWRILHRLR
jgi:hypothetical protein